jgi:hypothetical protein
MSEAIADVGEVRRPASRRFATAASANPADIKKKPLHNCKAHDAPYNNYACLDAYLGDGFFERLINYYRLEWGYEAAPTDPKAPPGRRDGCHGLRAAHDYVENEDFGGTLDVSTLSSSFLAFFAVFFAFLAAFRTSFVFLDIQCAPPTAFMAA